jgi:glutathione S-transferase
MITVHHLNNSRSQRILWLLEELGLAYEVVRYARDPATMRAPEALRRIHPLGKSPVITENGQTVAESGAIIEYLLETHGQGRLIPPAGTPDRQRYRYWLHYAEGSAMPLLLLKLVFMRMGQAPMPFFAKPIARVIAKKGQAMMVDPQLKTHMDYWEAELGRSDWFAGPEMTGADIQMSFPLEAATARAGAGNYPKIKAFLDRIHARPAYGRALEAGGPYELLR